MCDGSAFGDGAGGCGGDSLAAHSTMPGHGAHQHHRGLEGEPAATSTSAEIFTALATCFSKLNYVYWNYAGYVLLIFFASIVWRYLIVKIRTYHLMWTRIGESLNVFTTPGKARSHVSRQRPYRLADAEPDVIDVSGLNTSVPGAS